MLVISHDLSAMKDLTSKMMVLYGGEILERGATHEKASQNREVACHRGGIVDLICATNISKFYKIHKENLAGARRHCLRTILAFLQPPARRRLSCTYA